MSLRGIPDWVDYLVRSGLHAPSADNSQPWRFVWDGHSLELFMHEERGKDGLGADHPANLMALGAVVENLSQAAGALGMPADALQTGDPTGTGCMARVVWDAAGLQPLGALPAGVQQRHTNRGPFATTALDPELLAAVAALQEAPVRVVIVTERQQRERWSALVRKASELRFQTEEIHRWLAGSLRFTPEEVARGDGLDVATLLLPPGGESLLRLSLDWRRMELLNRFGGCKLFAMLEAAMLKNCAALVVLTGPPAGFGVEVAAGRLLQRVWIALNEEGVAVHPYFVLPDQLYRLRRGRVAPEFVHEVRRIEAGVGELLASRNETVLMLLRVGVPRVADPARSRRLPLARSFSTLVSH
ncbi:MAG: Nitroreductase family protein [Candidatus Accumulibacter adjunctus]|uniref:Nitroreductase family protein n=1 Tax=Candidatus Accumulibacter adjunctus TaxID=1454001 RepID=A0A011M5G4_9PROT|nr:MAG: Nitroreductase family protein [Candidatus Accumulibacter adjunctus]